jgi:PAS domain S-box-containing protein
MTEELGTVKKQFDTIFKFSPDGILIYDRQGILIQTNSASQEIFKYTEE